MERVKDFLHRNKLIIVICSIVIFTIMLPNLQKSFVIGDDYEYHLARIQSIQDALKTGVFPVKIHPLLGNSYGYGSGLFYPNLFLYIPAIIGLLGIDLLLSYKIFSCIMLMAMFVILYFSLKNITEDGITALIGTVIIMLSKSLALQFLHRFALGEFLGFIFIAPVISGIYDYVHNDFKKPYLLFIGFFGLINSHLITTLICVLYCAVIFLINIKSSIKNPKKILKLLITVLVVALITACFWMPMLEQMVKGEYKYSESWTNMANDEYSIFDLFGAKRYSIGILITLCVPLMIYGLLDKSISNKSKKFIITFIFIVILITNFNIWQKTKDFTNIIQFKWRFVGLLTVVAGITISLLLKEYAYKNEIKIEYVLFAILLISVFFFVQYYISDYKYPVLIESQEEVNKKIYILWNSIGGGTEYLPIETELNELYSPNKAIANNGDKIDVIKTNLRVEFEKTNQEHKSFEIPFIYYYGYVADITDINGNTVPLIVEKSENGLVQIKTEENIGTIHVWYNGTRLQKISYIIAMITYLFVFCYTIFIIKKKVLLIKVKMEKK